MKLAGKTFDVRGRAKASFCILIGGLLILAMLPTPRVSAAGLVQAPTPVVLNGNGAADVSISFTATEAGNLIVVVCSAGQANTLSVTGYTQAVNISGTVSQGIFYKIATGGETTATCTRATKKGIVAIQMYEYSGVQASPLGATGTATGTTAAVSSGSATPATSATLVFTAITALTGTTYTNPTAGYTERTDVFNSIHLGQADLFTGSTAAQSFSATNSATSAWRGQIVTFKLVPGTLVADIVDGVDAPVSAPGVAFAATTFDLTCQTATGTLGTASQRLKVNNTTFSPAWDLSIAPTAGATATWADAGTNKYDFNDPTGSGCTDGADADAFGGQLSINPSAGTITPGTGCASTGISLGSAQSFNQGVVDSVLLASGSASAPTNCSWYFTGIGLSQKVPAEQAESSYSLSLTITIVAK